MSAEKSKAIFIVGPTGVGKTIIGLYTAERLKGEIISADSRQMYRGMDIGTDKPPQEILNRVPHYFIDILDPDEYYNAGQYGKDVRKTIQEIILRKKLPIVVGGSGLYIKSIINGFFDEKIKDCEKKQMLQDRARKEGNEIMYAELKKVDPEFASRISLRDTQRIVRGLEVFLVTGKPLSQHWKKSHIILDFYPIIIGLRMDREKLYSKINKRVEKMFEKGLIDEIKMLLQKGYSQELNSLQTYGYRESLHYLQGKLTYDELVEKIQKHTRNFAKRQITWFKQFDNIHWVDVNEDTDKAVDTIITIIQEEK